MRWSWTDDVLPFVVMVMMTCLEMSVQTIVKAAMNGGMDSIVYIVYHCILGTFILLPFFVSHIYRNRNIGRPPHTFHILFRFFILGLTGICLFQVFLYQGISYSSPIMSSAINNLTPANTFLVAVIFRMETIDMRSSSSLAKLLGTITAISGAMVFSLYQSPDNSNINDSPMLLLSQPSNWVIGGLLLVISGICKSIWSVLQAATVREYPDRFTIVFLYNLFGAIQSIALSLVLERNPSAWVLQPGIQMFAVVFGAVFLIAIRSNAETWCLGKKGPVFVAMFSPLAIVFAVILGVIFLGDSLHVGSAIGAAIVVAGFYTVMWGEAKQKNKSPMVMKKDSHDVADEAGSSSQNTPLLPSRNDE